MNKYRCTNCGTEFEADRPACQTCDIDATKEPHYAAVIHKLEVVHFEAPGKVKGRGVGYPACDPAKKTGGPVRATAEPSAANCKACRATEAWKAADYGEPVAQDEGEGTVTTSPCG